MSQRVTYTMTSHPGIEHEATGLMQRVVLRFAEAFGGAIHATITLPDDSGFSFTIHEDES